MKSYFKKMLFEPITTVAQAKETVKLSAYGLYILGYITLVDLLIRLILHSQFIIKQVPDREEIASILAFFFVMGTAFLLTRSKNRGLGSIIVIYFTFGFLMGLAPSQFGMQIGSSGFDYLRWFYIQIFFGIGVILAYGGARGSLKYHQLQGKEKLNGQQDRNRFGG